MVTTQHNYLNIDEENKIKTKTKIREEKRKKKIWKVGDINYTNMTSSVKTNHM